MKIQVSMTFQELEDLVREQTGMDIAIIGDVEMTDEGFTFLAGSGSDKPAKEVKKTAIPKRPVKEESVKTKNTKSVKEEQIELPFEEEPVKEAKEEETPLAADVTKPSLFGKDAKKDSEEKSTTKSLFG